MRTVIVDDDEVSLSILQELCGMSSEVELIGTFTEPNEAVAFAENNYIEFALLDIEMPGMTGIELAGKLREKVPKLVVIFTTAYEDYYMQAMGIMADFYMMKPYSKVKVEDAVERARLLCGRLDKRIKVTMIGPYSIILDGKPVKFTNAKARELLALCLDHRGGLVSREEAVDKLWAEKEYDKKAKKLFNKAENYIKHFCVDHQLESFFVTTYQGCYIDPSFVECDFYAYADEHGKYSIPENYLQEFEWAYEF